MAAATGDVAEMADGTLGLSAAAIAWARSAGAEAPEHARIAAFGAIVGWLTDEHPEIAAEAAAAFTRWTQE